MSSSSAKPKKSQSPPPPPPPPHDPAFLKTYYEKEDAKRTEAQAHGFSWEKDILTNVYGATEEELKAINYTSASDLPAKYNRLEPCKLSIKTSCSANTVCMADCLRVYDKVVSGRPLHLVVIHYAQNDAKKTKKITSIVEVDLTSSTQLLFGSLSRDAVEQLDALVKTVPQKRRPTKEEHELMYKLQAKLQEKSGHIYLNIKCDSSQSRLQCSFNRFQTFLKENPDRIVSQSSTHEFRGGSIAAEISSSRRVFKSKEQKAAEAEAAEKKAKVKTEEKAKAKAKGETKIRSKAKK